MVTGKPKTTPAEFKKALQGYATRHIKEVVVARQSKVAGLLWEGIKTKSAVDTGLSRNNWNASIGTPDFTVDPTALGGVSLGSELTATEKGKLRTVQKRLEGLPLGQVLWVANGVHYIVYLEGGWSQQAPVGMVGVTLAELASKLPSKGGS